MSTQTFEGLIPISIATLSPKALMGVDIYLKANPGTPPVLFFACDELPDFARLTPLASEGVNKLFIDRNDGGKYQAYLRENWKQLIEDDSQPIANRVSVMSEVMRDVLSAEFSVGDTTDIVLASQELGKGTCQLIDREHLFARQLCSVLHHDYATFTHCTNVSLYSVLLARELGYSGAELQEIAVGALLHDLGKLQIDERILTKPGRLDEFEFREIQKHPVRGYQELVHRNDLTFGQLMMTYQHHERINGTGYPVACCGNEIHPWAKICAVVDVYEAITSQRPYRVPMTHKTALAVLEKGAGTELDAEIVRCWHYLISQRDEGQHGT
jgi:HD-GYP domain-containing protein (c-di-GMP phosphodiesterase class II)